MKIGIRSVLVFGLVFGLAGSTTAFAVKTHNHRDAGRHGKNQARHHGRMSAVHHRLGKHGKRKGSAAAIKDTVRIVGLPSHLVVGQPYTYYSKGTYAPPVNDISVLAGPGLRSCPPTFAAVHKKLKQQRKQGIKAGITVKSVVVKGKEFAGPFINRTTVTALVPFTGGACSYLVNTNDPTAPTFAHAFQAITASSVAPTLGRG